MIRCSLITYAFISKPNTTKPMPSLLPANEDASTAKRTPYARMPLTRCDSIQTSIVAPGEAFHDYAPSCGCVAFKAIWYVDGAREDLGKPRPNRENGTGQSVKTKADRK